MAGRAGTNPGRGIDIRLGFLNACPMIRIPAQSGAWHGAGPGRKWAMQAHARTLSHSLTYEVRELPDTHAHTHTLTGRAIGGVGFPFGNNGEAPLAEASPPRMSSVECAPCERVACPARHNSIKK